LRSTELPAIERLAQFHSERKYFIDTMKIAARRAESGLVGEVPEVFARSSDAGVFFRRIVITPAKLTPDYQAPTPNVEIQRCGSSFQGNVISGLYEIRTST
jgi:hypothetical protein